MTADAHALIRTSPYGEAFVGTCMKCGKEDLPLNAMWDECPNPSGMTDAQAMAIAIRGGNS